MGLALLNLCPLEEKGISIPTIKVREQTFEHLKWCVCSPHTGLDKKSKSLEVMTIVEVALDVPGKANQQLPSLSKWISKGLTSLTLTSLHISLSEILCSHSKNKRGVPVVAQQKWIQRGTVRLRVQSLASINGLRIRRCRELWCGSQTLGCGVGRQPQLWFDP